VLYGILALVATIVVLDQVLWRPLLAWADKFRVDTVAGDEPVNSWCGRLLSRSIILERARERVVAPLVERSDAALARRLKDPPAQRTGPGSSGRPSAAAITGSTALALLVLYGGYRAAGMLSTLPATMWRPILAGLGATFLRVAAALL